MKRTLLPVFLAGLWINLCEFLRNEILFKSYWVDHFTGMGLEFPSEPLNGILWVVWGFVFAGFIRIIGQRFCAPHAFILAWTAGFLLMWIAAWNLSVLPLELLPIAVPFSMAEVLGAVLIAGRTGSCKQKDLRSSGGH